MLEYCRAVLPFLVTDVFSAFTQTLSGFDFWVRHARFMQGPQQLSVSLGLLAPECLDSLLNLRDALPFRLVVL
jgi:hypothetical protein